MGRYEKAFEITGVVQERQNMEKWKRERRLERLIEIPFHLFPKRFPTGSLMMRNFRNVLNKAEQSERLQLDTRAFKTG